MRGNALDLAQAWDRSDTQHSIYPHLQMFSFFGTESNSLTLVSLSNFKQVKNGTKPKREKSKNLAKLGPEATPAL